jgi:hypothetical protein
MSKAKPTKEERIVQKILKELAGRAGFDSWWDEIDETTQEEITEALVEIVEVEEEDDL